MTTKLWEYGTPHSLVTTDEVGAFELIRLKWLATRSQEAVTFQKSYTTKRGILAVADLIAATLQTGPLMSPYQHQIILEAEDTLSVVHRSSKHHNDDYPQTATEVDDDDQDEEGVVFSTSKNVTFEVLVTGHRNKVAHMFKILDREFKDEQEAMLKWWYKADNGETTYRQIFLPPLKTSLIPELYPTLDDTPQNFLHKYLDSEAAILLIAGPPGTGKTTLLRHLICEFKLSAHVVYDEVLMRTDKVFQNFLFEAHSDLLVIEDADHILADREHSENTLMARFLNVSDGLIKLPNKKLVFTTNINDFGRVDPALLRPGRCFQAIHTRGLNLTEAQACARAASLPMPIGKRDEYTLAELFNGMVGPTVRKIGF